MSMEEQKMTLWLCVDKRYPAREAVWLRRSSKTQSGHSCQPLSGREGEVGGWT